ncbi:unnamed protein product [Cylindrotheca closterium]|uniref:Uncharacterized protein n=1 Tax=Cylindrotheca closterium TaxID=2856 RepID=A0AAD2CUB4_9STRA|nr:unnamed protein product [Cylindrotheca closterium]
MGILSKKSKAAATGAVCASAACAVGATVVPESMKLTSVMKGFHWNEVPLTPVDFNVGIQLLAEQKANEVIQKHTGPHGSIAFVVRRPGDESLKFYEALGNRSITEHVLYNPFKAISALRRHMSRLKEKKIEGNLKGEGLKSGGLIIFGKDGSPQFMVPEQTGTPFDEDELLAALETVRKGGGVTDAGEL